MIDTDKYEGHSPAPWTLSEEYAYELFVYAGDTRLAKMDGNMKNDANEQLIADAPLLLEEVKRLREGILNVMAGIYDNMYDMNQALDRVILND